MTGEIKTSEVFENILKTSEVFSGFSLSSKRSNSSKSLLLYTTIFTSLFHPACDSVSKSITAEYPDRASPMF